MSSDWKAANVSLTLLFVNNLVTLTPKQPNKSLLQTAKQLNECWRKYIFVAETLGFKVRLDLDCSYAAFQHTDLDPLISFYAQISNVGGEGEYDT